MYLRICVPDADVIARRSCAFQGVLDRSAVEIVVKDQHVVALCRGEAVLDGSGAERAERNFVAAVDNRGHDVLDGDARSFELLVRKGLADGCLGFLGLLFLEIFFGDDGNAGVLGDTFDNLYVI